MNGLSEIKLHTKMCNVRTYVTHKCEICSIRTKLQTEMYYVRTYVTHDNTMSSDRTYAT